MDFGQLKLPRVPHYERPVAGSIAGACEMWAGLYSADATAKRRELAARLRSMRGVLEEVDE